jgi:hypothetical protein
MMDVKRRGETIMTREELLEMLFDIAKLMRVEVVQDDYGKMTVAFYPEEQEWHEGSIQ